MFHKAAPPSLCPTPFWSPHLPLPMWYPLVPPLVPNPHAVRYALQPTCESSWTIVKLSPTLCWLEDFDSIADVVAAFYRRVCVFPLYRHFPLAQRCVKDVVMLLQTGPKVLVRVLLAVKHILERCRPFGEGCFVCLWGGLLRVLMPRGHLWVFVPEGGAYPASPPSAHKYAIG